MTSEENIRAGLVARQQELTEKISEIDAMLREPDSADAEDRATENEDDEVLEDIGNVALQEIAQIDAALKRLDLGTFGACTVCHAPIDDKRLEALPYAATCIDCTT